MGNLEQDLPLIPESTDLALPVLGKLHEWVITVDHKRLGLMYIGGGLTFFLIAGLQAATMRLQLVVPDAGIVPPQTFNRLLTMHGTAMVFLVGMPILTGFFNYLVPLMIGARDLAFPRLNAFGFWLWLFGGLLLYFSYIGSEGLYGAGSAPDVGWFAYAPLTERAFSRGNSTDYWILSIFLTSVGSTATAVNIIATAFCMRCEGMTLRKMPILVWLAIVTSFLMLVALPPLSAAQVMLLLDRFLGTHFFDTQAGGSAILWQHFFWIFGHPEVYVLVMPAFAFASEIIPVFSRKVIFGYDVMVTASIAIGFISLSVWAHHMFAVGMTPSGNAFFATSTMLVGVPTGIKIFNWLATMWGGKIRLRVPMLFAIAFLFQFLIAGLTGIILSVAPFDWQLTDTYFVVAHFHYVLIGAIIFMDLRGDLLLVPQGHRPDAERAPRQVAFLALPGRLSPDFRHPALRRPQGDAAPDLHLPTRPRPRDAQPGRVNRRHLPGGGRADARDQRGPLAAVGRYRRR